MDLYGVWLYVSIDINWKIYTVPSKKGRNEICGHEGKNKWHPVVEISKDFEVKLLNLDPGPGVAAVWSELQILLTLVFLSVKCR